MVCIAGWLITVMRSRQGVENLHRVCLAKGIGQIVIADQNHHRHLRLDQTPYTAGKFALPGGIGIAVFVDVAGENRQVNIVFQGIINGQVDRAGEIQQTTIQTSGSIQPAIVFHAEVDVSQMTGGLQTPYA